MKTSTLKKVLSIVIVSIVLALVAVTIILAVVPKRFGNIISDNYATLSVYKDGKENLFVYNGQSTDESDVKQNKVINEIVRLHKESLKDNLLSAIFQGTGSFKIEVLQDPETSVINFVDKEGVYGLVFDYTTPQTLKVDGAELKYEETLSSKTVTYNRIVMPLKDTNRFDDNVIYLCNSSSDSTYQVRYIAHQSDICDYIDSIANLLHD